MFLSQKIDVKLCQNYTKTYKCKILCKIRNIKQIMFNKYSTNLKTTISQWSLRNSGVLLILFELNNVSILIDITDDIRPDHVTSTPTNGSAVLLSRASGLYHVTSTPHCHWREFWSRDTDVYLTYIPFGIILTQFQVNFSRQEHHIVVLQVTFNF